MLAVAPVKIRVGGWVVPLGALGWTWARRRGREWWERRKAPLLGMRSKRV